MKINFRDIQYPIPSGDVLYNIIIHIVKNKRTLDENGIILYKNSDSKYYYVYKDRYGLNKELNDLIYYKLVDGVIVGNLSTKI